ncbi:MAG TPA: hypothetical protein VFV99_14555 [Kofleriaceae bacterium]|nr:hypothetical protein [Kofleriaceae bacterium]
MARADAAPTADLVVVWAPGLRTAPVVQAARGAGAAILDRSPKPEGTATTAQLVQKGLDAFERLEFDQAWQQLDSARSEVDRTGAAGLTQAQLSDLFLYRGLIKTQQGDSNGAWEELIVANTVDATRELDPGRFPPKIIAEFERAQATVKNKGGAELTLTVPQGCRATVDATNVNVATAIPLIVGRHWVRVTCPDREPDGRRVELVGGKITLPITPPEFAAPTDTELLGQAQRSGARAFIVAEVRNNVATARLVGLDGKERDRKTVTIGTDLEPLADAVSALLTPRAHRPWYKSKWAWAVGGAVGAAAIVIPLTIFATQDSGSPAFTARPDWPDRYVPL